MRATRFHLILLMCSVVGLVAIAGGWGRDGSMARPVSLEEEVELAGALVSANQALREEIERLDRELAALTEPSGGGRLEDMTASLNQLRIVNGAVAVVGPGIEMAVSGSVTAAGVRDLVNELKSAGAEAIAVNGRRVTAWSSFYEGPQGTIMDGHPLGSQVTIQAIGDPVALREVAKRRGGFAAALQADGAQLDIRLRTGQSELCLPVSLERRGFQHGRLPQGGGLDAR
ncbi:MAG: DUF881 domain-containing protein [Anaerolineae bacterium]|nr:DUF881 domain-containing protein [Anaerolineae bacterium]